MVCPSPSVDFDDALDIRATFVACPGSAAEAAFLIAVLSSAILVAPTVPLLGFASLEGIFIWFRVFSVARESTATLCFGGLRGVK